MIIKKLRDISLKWPRDQCRVSSVYIMEQLYKQVYEREDRRHKTQKPKIQDDW